MNQPFIEIRLNKEGQLQYRCWKVNIGLGNRMGPHMHEDEDGRVVPEWTDWMPVKRERDNG
jgi:hypothetical protein